jgi:hypothetical protein
MAPSSASQETAGLKSQPPNQDGPLARVQPSGLVIRLLANERPIELPVAAAILADRDQTSKPVPANRQTHVTDVGVC